jgi:uncharacterized phage-associated protein
MNRLEDRVATTVNAILYILTKIGGQGDFHKVFKVLYFADQEHLCKYGSLITNDKYVAMNNGPVPSMAYDILKALRGDGLLSNFKKDFDPFFELKSNYLVDAKVEPDLDELSESEIECIDKAISENKSLNFKKLTQKSHDSAWAKTSRDCEMNLKHIAEAAGANKGMVKYIHEVYENQNAIFE